MKNSNHKKSPNSNTPRGVTVSSRGHTLNATHVGQLSLPPVNESMPISLLTSLFPVPCLHFCGPLLPTYTYTSPCNHLSAQIDF